MTSGSSPLSAPSFAPIAIVGQGCVLPGAHRPEELWDLVTSGDDMLGLPPVHYWGVAPERVSTSPDRPSGDRTWSPRGGYVRDFASTFDASRFQLEEAFVRQLDPLFQWTLEAARQAWEGAGYSSASRTERAGVILGNLSYPTRALSDFALDVWRGEPSSTLAHNRYMSGLPAQIIARALGAAGDSSAFCLDAACASSLYAIKLASERLQDGRADVMLVGGVNHADDLFLHIGFCALKAMSRTGQSRPFHSDADGLVPAEGAGFVVLKRLEDAVREGDHILGIIRGVGLSNDGRGRGMLTPSEDGQWRAMMQAYEMSGLSPQDISLVECHATGTPLGDATELRSMARVFDGQIEGRVPIGSLKSNLGHLITASGVAGLLKVLAAMKHKQRPPTIHVDEPVEWLGETPFRLLHEVEPWACDGLRRAAINNFGFGGNNAHLLVEEWAGQSFATAPSARAREQGSVAIVAASAMVATLKDVDALGERLLFGDGSALRVKAMDDIEVDITQLKFPPNDLAHTLPQQLLALKTAMQLTDKIATLPGQSTGIYMGMQCDTEIARYGARWRMANLHPDDDPLSSERDAIIQSLQAAGVLGTMPNIVSNRMNSQFNLLGPSYTVSAEEASGLVAVELAARALVHHDLDAALVGAVDLCVDPVHEAAAREVLPESHHEGGDVGVMVILKRLADARRDGDEILAVLDTDTSPSEQVTLRLGDTGDDALDLAHRFGHAHAASGMLHLLAASVCTQHRAILHDDARATPHLGEEYVVEITSSPLCGEPLSMRLRRDAQASVDDRFHTRPLLHLFSGESLEDLARALGDDHVRMSAGPMRLAIVSTDTDLEAKRARAIAQLESGEVSAHAEPYVMLEEGVFFASRALDTERLEAMSSSTPISPQACRELLLAMPHLVDAIRGDFEALERDVSWLYSPHKADVSPREREEATRFVEALHEHFARQVMGLPTHLSIDCSESLDAMTSALAKLFVCGVDAKWSAWSHTRGEGARAPAARQILKRYPAHLPAVHIARDPMRDVEESTSAHEKLPAQGTPSAHGERRMPPPLLPPILHDNSLALAHTAPQDLPSYRLEAPPSRVHLSPPTPPVSVEPPVTHSNEKRPVLSPATTQETPRAPEPSTHARLHDVKSSPQGAERVPSTLSDSPSDAVARHFASLTALHEQFLSQQAELQREFIASRERLLAQIASAQHGGVQQPSPTQGFATPPQSASGELDASGVEIEAGRDSALMDTAITTPLFALPSAIDSLPSGGALHTPVPTPSHDEARAKAPARQTDIDQTKAKVISSKSLEKNKMLARSTDQSMPSQVPLKAPVSLPAKTPRVDTKGRAPKGAAANLQRHVITPSSEKPSPIGPTYDYDQIAIHASGKISDIFGSPFEIQDDWQVQVRMPEPPLLLCHRVTGIDCTKAQVGTGTLWCESDIPEDAWFLHEGRMPVGIMIESGQADLMLISYMGADFENKGDRVYRLLGCELMFHGGLAEPGDTLKYDIHIDGHARQDAIRLFFFHYDLEIDDQVRLSVRNGQAGFFSYEELAESNGILWTPEDEDRAEVLATPFDAHPHVTPKRAFTEGDVQRFSEGGGYEVFGQGFEKIAAHTRTPRIQSDKMRFMDEVLEFDPTGGPWGRGYLKAVQHIEKNNWFFDGHFLNDPCMPGTLMFEGCVQVMAFYMAACGWTIERDGWVFEPVPFEAYPLRCRGQVAPGAKEVLYEVLVREVHDGEVPKLYADLMCTVDGLKAFHCGRMGLQLSPSWPMDRMPGLLEDHKEPKPVAVARDGHTFDYDSLLACAWGRPTRAFGSMYAPFDSHRTVARLPGPPYHFISRVTQVDQDAQNAMTSGCAIKVEYDVPKDAWYFKENGAAVMPYAVLLEAALQPCGWLASYVGCALTRDDIDLAFRNLDGTTTQMIEVTPTTGTLETTTTLTNIARAGGNIIVSFLVEMRELSSGDTVLTMDTVFGFFPPDSLANQVGLPIKEEHRERFDATSDEPVDLTTRPARYCEGSLRLANPMLLMLDRVTVHDPRGGAKELGFYRAEKDVDPNEWFFKAHFFQDPVQPGSLGLEALLQLLQFAMLDKELDAGMQAPRFEAIATGEPIAWKYRGQVLTHNSIITSTLEIEEIRHEGEHSVLALASGSLWVDGMRIYQSTQIGMRVVDGELVTTETDDYVLEQLSEVSMVSEQEVTVKKPQGASRLHRTFTLKPRGEDGWLLDHCPTYTDPALPMMSIIDLLAQQAARARDGEVVTSLKQVKLKKWVIFPDGASRKLRTTFIPESQEVVLELWWDAPNPKLSRFDEGARAHVSCAPTWPTERPESFAPLAKPARLSNPYESGELFHGDAFQMLMDVWRNDVGASGVLDLAKNGVPRGLVQPGVLDAALQILPHDAIETWWHDHPGDVIAYPHEVSQIDFYGPAPRHDAMVRSEVRFVGGRDHTATCDVQILTEEHTPWMMMRLTEILFPKGPIGRLDGATRRSFLRERVHTPGASLSEVGEDFTTCSVQSVMESNWFKGTLERVYHVSGSPLELARDIAIKDHIAAKLAVHPGELTVDHRYDRVSFQGAPLLGVSFEAVANESAQQWTARLTHNQRVDAMASLDVEHIERWWADRLGVPHTWLGGDLYRAMIERFVERVEFEDLAAMAGIVGRPVLFLGNHEVQIESLLITILGSVLVDNVVITMANAKHERGWVGALIRELFAYPGCEDPENIVYFDQSDPASMFDLIERFGREVKARGASVMVHAPGTRARAAGEPVERVSSALLDMALDLGLTIIPVHFCGGLPREQISAKLEFPLAQTGQIYRFGQPISPDRLAALPYGERRRAVLAAINRLVPDAPGPHAPRQDRQEAIDALMASGLGEVNATLLDLLRELDTPSEDAAALLAQISGVPQEVVVDPSAERLTWIERFKKRFDANSAG